ncbi:MAG TPA: pyridoxal phosphate-dependent aminotransferase, partial [Roseibacterium sp.]|nr:pyridoxal phosphate-dependent aminotransferase [Roseibacterium sp.]
VGANENVFGPSPRAIRAMQDAAADIWMYGDPENHDLRVALAGFHGVAPENIIVGEGIDGLLGYLARLLLEPGDAVVTSAGAYPTFNYHVAGFGGVLHTVPFVEDREDPASLFAKAGKVGAKLVYLANPDNPMGTWHKGVDIVAAMADLPKGCLLVLDEAYVESAPQGTAVRIDADDQRLIIMRTFSKAYGMAGARVGYGIGAPEMISAFNKVRNHFGMNRAAQAGALAALADKEWLAHVLAEIDAARRRIADIARENGLTPLASATNFVTIDCGRDGVFAKAVLDGLVARGIFVRMPFAAPQNRCIRVSAGKNSDLDAFASALPEAARDSCPIPLQASKWFGASRKQMTALPK